MRKVIHPFLFVLIPISSLFAYNIEEVHPTDLLPPITFSLVGVVIFFFLSRLLTKSYIKGGVLTSFFLLLFFSFGPVRNAIYSTGWTTTGLFGVPGVLTLLWTIIFIFGTFLIMRTHRDFLSLTKYLNIMAVVVLAISSIGAGIYFISKPSYIPEPIPSEWSNPTELPDIYYIILDVYARQDTLKEDFNHDNGEFIDYLTNKGFYVATKSISNYDYTTYSLSSSLNMEYHAEGGQETEILYEMIANSKVSNFLKEMGYTYIYIDGGVSGFSRHMLGHADFTLKYESDSIFKKTPFLEAWLRDTALSTVAWHWLEFWSTDERKMALYPFEELVKMPNIEGAKFIYAHICLPHPPYMFDQDGNYVPPDLLYDVGNILKHTHHKERYVNQLVYTNKRTMEVIDEILANSDKEPIIILQSDQGPWWIKGGSFKILNAYYFLKKNNYLLYETISPVNSFRVLFNLYFDASYPLLEDKSYETGLHPWETSWEVE